MAALLSGPGDWLNVRKKSGGGPPQSKTLRAQLAQEQREASWTAPALWRFAPQAKTCQNHLERPTVGTQDYLAQGYDSVDYDVIGGLDVEVGKLKASVPTIRARVFPEFPAAG